MIKSADEFKALRESETQEEYARAAHEQAPIEVWYEVLTKYPDLAFWVAQNKTIPIEVLNKLAMHENSNTRCMVARKRKLPEETMLLLTKDTDESVRHALASNAKVTRKILEILAHDPWENVRNVARRKLEL